MLVTLQFIQVKQKSPQKGDILRLGKSAELEKTLCVSFLGTKFAHASLLRVHPKMQPASQLSGFNPLWQLVIWLLGPDAFFGFMLGFF